MINNQYILKAEVQYRQERVRTEFEQLNIKKDRNSLSNFFNSLFSRVERKPVCKKVCHTQ